MFWLIGFLTVGGMAGIVVLGWFLIGSLKEFAFQPFDKNSEPLPTKTIISSDSTSPVSGEKKFAPTKYLPPLPPSSKVSGTELRVHDVRFTGPTQRTMHARIYMPKGTHAAASLGCIFTAPAGTPLLHGVDIGFEDNMEEILPYVNAGFVVTIFDMDGVMPDLLSPDMGRIYFSALKSAYDDFVKAEAGVLNGKSAIDYVLASVPEVDPKKLYSSGHSSAATLSLLLAAKDDRISKCIAFAPITDLNSRFGDMANDRTVKQYLSNLKEYSRTGSPITYASQYRCPLFILHAMDDQNEPFESTKRFVSMLSGPSVTFVQERRGGHYDPMVKVGLPKAIDWLKQ